MCEWKGRSGGRSGARPRRRHTESQHRKKSTSKERGQRINAASPIPVNATWTSPLGHSIDTAPRMLIRTTSQVGQNRRSQIGQNRRFQYTSPAKAPPRHRQYRLHEHCHGLPVHEYSTVNTSNTALPIHQGSLINTQSQCFQYVDSLLSKSHFSVVNIPIRYSIANRSMQRQYHLAKHKCRIAKTT